MSTTPIASFICVPQHKISYVRGAALANQLRNLFIGQAAFFSFAATLTGHARHSTFLFFGRFKKYRFIHSGNAPPWVRMTAMTDAWVSEWDMVSPTQVAGIELDVPFHQGWPFAIK